MNTMKLSTLSLSLLAAIALVSCDKPAADQPQDEPETKINDCSGQGYCLPTPNLSGETDGYGNVTIRWTPSSDHTVTLSYVGYVTDGSDNTSGKVLSRNNILLSSLPDNQLTIPTGQGTCEIQFRFHCTNGDRPVHYPEINCMTYDAGFSYFRKDKDALGHMFSRGYLGYNTPAVTPSQTNPANALRVLAPYVNNALDHRRAMVTHYTIRDLSLDHDETRGDVRYFEDINVPIGAAGHTYQIRFYNPNAGGAGYLYIEFQGGRTDTHKWGQVQTSTGSAT